MDKSIKVDNEIRISSKGSIDRYIVRALSLLEERKGEGIVLKALGQAINKAVNIAENLKRTYPGLYQDTAIGSLSITEMREPVKEGLLPKITRNVSMVSITLAAKQLNKNSPGYQPPDDLAEPKPLCNDTYNSTDEGVLISKLESLAIKSSESFAYKSKSGGAKKRDSEKKKSLPVQVRKALSLKLHPEMGADGFILEDEDLKFILPSRLVKELYDHQLDGVKWLWSLHCQNKGGILADDMGLGKTRQVCRFVAGLFHSRLVERVLVVCPKILVSEWEKEINLADLSKNFREYSGSKSRDGLHYVLQGEGVLVTSYGTARHNVESLCGGNGFSWDYMIVDEAHLVKNPSTQRAQSLVKIPARHRIAVTGTPLQNNHEDLWAIFNFCYPELLGDEQSFKTTYADPICKGSEKDASKENMRRSSEASKMLRAVIEPFFLRRNKSVLSGLPPKHEIVIWLALSDYQRKLYKAFLDSRVHSRDKGSALSCLTALKKICSHPRLISKEAVEDLQKKTGTKDEYWADILTEHKKYVGGTLDIYKPPDDSVKIPFIMSLVDELVGTGHVLLIFSQFLKMLDLIEQYLESLEHELLRIDGNTKEEARKSIIKDFTDKRGPPILLLSTGVGGVGLNLTRASRVILVDPAWNPSTDNQAVDRVYRIGQDKDVIIYRLITCGTIEEVAYQKQILKGWYFKSVTESEERERYLTKEEFNHVFRVGEGDFDRSLTKEILYTHHDCESIVNSELLAHIEFLKSLRVVGHSFHSLLFSKTLRELAPRLRQLSELSPIEILKPDDPKWSKKSSKAMIQKGPKVSRLQFDTEEQAAKNLMQSEGQLSRVRKMI